MLIKLNNLRKLSLVYASGVTRCISYGKPIVSIVKLRRLGLLGCWLDLILIHIIFYFNSFFVV